MEKVERVIECFNKEFPDAKCELNYETPYQLLVAVILSAQCTDKRVCSVCEKLFTLAPTPDKMLGLGEVKLKKIIYSCGFYNNKAKSILSASRSLIDNFEGNVPSSMDTLISLDGVGRKTANVVLAEAFKQPAIAVDTHVLRVSKRLGLTKINSTPEQCEQDLIKVIPKDKQSKFHIQAVWFGRYKCKSKNPDCERCKLKDMCNYIKQTH